MCKNNSIYLRPRPEDKTVIRKFVPSTTTLQWIRRDNPRDPTPRKANYDLSQGFIAAGKVYRELQSLSTEKPGNTPGTFLDIYGREVLCFQERFPCFDSFDYLYENRYFRWFYIFDGSSLTEVYYEDERPHVHITEDVQEVPNKWWPAIEKAWGRKAL